MSIMEDQQRYCLEVSGSKSKNETEKRVYYRNAKKFVATR